MKYLEVLYEQTILKLKNNERPLIRLTPELIKDLKAEWNKAIDPENVDSVALKKILCILDNTQNMTSELNEQFIKTLKKVKDQDLLIYTLAASQKHVINESLRTGNMISQEYLEKLKELLKNKNPEVVEWTLRTIETMGPLSLRFMNDVKNINLGFFKFLNKHNKSSEQIISLMKLQWEKMRS
jgi:Fe-S-cluster formation regulator IscX/YfhJ